MVGKRGEQEWQAGDNHRLHLMAVAPRIEVEVLWSTAEPLVVTNLEVDDEAAAVMADIAGFADYSAIVSEGELGGQSLPAISVTVAQEVVAGGAVTTEGDSEASEAEEEEMSAAASTASAVVAGEEVVLDGERRTGSAAFGLRREDEEEILEALKDSSNGVASSLLTDALGPALRGSAQQPAPR